MISSYAIGLLGIALVLTFWLGVQLAWRRSFPQASDDPDALAGRAGCGGCDRSETCPTPGVATPPTAKETP